MKIDCFSNEFDFLSNFYFCRVPFEGRVYPSSEHAFQAAKTFDDRERERIQQEPSPGRAKRLGRKVALRRDWDSVRVDVMLEICRIKFQDQQLRERLLATGNAELIEGNTWNDQFWGVCNGRGKNHLGKILMQIREEIQR